jgi:hypothetical protein
MKPMSASEVLKTTSFVHRNRYEVLRPRSDSVGGKSITLNRERSNSVKRKASGDINDDNQKKMYCTDPPPTREQCFDSMTQKINIMKGIRGKISDDAAKVKLDPALESIIKHICEFIDLSVSYHEEVAGNATTIDSGASDTQNEPRALESSQESEGEVFVTYSHAAKKPPRVLAPAPKPQQKKDPKLQAFQDAVKHAERSTLIFNLNLGSKKTLNEKTILSNATLALSNAAAEVEGREGRGPSKESISALDDVMSVTQNVVLYGKVTRPFENKKNPQDPKNKSFFTLPIRYEFKDRETRLEAETILRDTCKIDCTTPYPANLRSCIRQTIDHFRKDYPEDYIKVTVDTQDLTLRVSRKVKGDGWYNHKEPIPIPELALDIRSRFPNKDLVMKDLPKRHNSRNRSVPDDDPEMDSQNV